MKKFTLILLFILLFLASYSQFRYVNSIFNKADTLKNIEYAQADFLNNKIGLLADYNIHDGENRTETRPLYMDIFMPHGDTVTKRPAIIFAHSGAFLIGSRKADDMVAMCDSFARRGFVTATIDYRMGMGSTVSRFLGIIVNIKIEDQNGYRAGYRAAQDARAAIRFLKYNADIYGIDTTKIFFTGSSAGGILGLYNIYTDKTDEFNDAVFEEPSLGSIDKVGIQGYGSKANAIVSMWGAVQNPDVIENEATPVLLIHGTDDKIVPFKKGIPLEGVVPDNPVLSFSMPETYGSFCIDSALTSKNIFHETYFVEGKNHEFYGAETGEFPPEGPNVYWDTVQTRIAHFFFSLFQPEANFEYLANNLAIQFSNTSSQTDYSFWDFGDGTFGTGTEILHEFTEAGNYMVKLTTCNLNMACDTLSKTITTGTSVFALNPLSNQIRVYPNPVKDWLKINGTTETYGAKIYDFTGRIQFEEKNIQQSTIDVSSFQNGIYFIEISFEDQSVVRKFVKVD